MAGRVSHQAVSLDLAPASKQTLAEDIADRIREAIIRGHLPPGERLREEQLASTLEVSRGPVREALSSLEAEHLVVVRRNRGAIVASLTAQDLEEVYSLRVAIERLTVRWAVWHATDDDLDRVEAVLDEFRVALDGSVGEHEAAELDIRFHDAIYRAAHHRRLYALWSSLRPQVRVFLLRRNIANPDWRPLMVSGHQAILDTLRARDAVAADARIADHLTTAYDRIRAGFDA